MTVKIVDYDDPYYHGLLVNTLWGGERGVCVQFTEGDGQKGYVQMTLEEALAFLKETLRRLEK